MSNNRNFLRTRHEAWCLRVVLRLCGPLKIHHVFRQNRVVDAISFMPKPVELWGPLTPYVTGRDVLVEHFSNSVSVADMSVCREKIAYASYRYEKVPLKDRGDKKAPLMTILSHRLPERLIREPGLFEETDTRGIYVRKPVEMGGIFLVAASHLPPDPRFDWLRMSTRAPESRSDFERVDELLKNQKLDKLTQEEVEEAMIQLMIDGKTPLELLEQVTTLERQKRSLQSEIAVRTSELEERSRQAEEQRREAEEQRREAEEQTRQAEEHRLEIAELRRQLEELKKS